MSAERPRINPALDGVDLSRPNAELLQLPGVTRKMIVNARRVTGVSAARNSARNLKPAPAKLAGADLTRPTRELCAEYGCTRTAVTHRRRALGIPAPPRERRAPAPKTPRAPKTSAARPSLADVDLTLPIEELVQLTGRSRATVQRAKRAAGLTRPRPPRPPRAAATPKPTPKTPTTPIARQGRTSPRESAAAVAPPEPIAANDLDAQIRAAVTDEVRVMGVSPFVASVVVAARFRVAREMVEAVAEDVAGMRRRVAHG